VKLPSDRIISDDGFDTIAAMDWSRLFGRFSSSPALVYADFIDPFSYVGFHNLCRATATRSVLLEWRGFEFNPDTPPDGYFLLTQLNSDLRAGMWASVEGYAKRSDVRLNEPQAVYNTQRAQHIVRRLPAGPEKNTLILKIFRAYFEDGADISRSAVLEKLLESFASLTAPARQKLLRETPLVLKLEANRREAERLAFPGLPGFFWNGRPYFGALSTEAWESIFDHHEPKELACSTR
jgi:predicted DsbA family dithiol-disulfide isomerase